YGDEEESGSERVRWRRVEHCCSITQSECDLSQETFSLEEDYYARVRAASANTQSVWTESTSRFSPALHNTSAVQEQDCHELIVSSVHIVLIPADVSVINTVLLLIDPRRAAAGADRAAELHKRHDQGALQMENQEDTEGEVTLDDLPTHDL
ncbi:hypothetical protein cypCar_00045046, partial [Cyprinus carpio]